MFVVDSLTARGKVFVADSAREARGSVFVSDSGSEEEGVVLPSFAAGCLVVCTILRSCHGVCLRCPCFHVTARCSVPTAPVPPAIECARASDFPLLACDALAADPLPTVCSVMSVPALLLFNARAHATDFPITVL